MGKVALSNEVLFGEVTRMLDEGLEVAMTPKGNSMLPFIHGGKDSVTLKRKGTYAVGDIVLACFNGRYVLHRIIAIDGDKVTLMGDGNLQGCEKGRIDELCGTVVEIVNGKGRRRKPGKGRLWRRLLPVRRYILKIHRKWNKCFRPELIS